MLSLQQAREQHTDGDGLRRCRCCSLSSRSFKWGENEVQHVCPKTLSDGKMARLSRDIAQDKSTHFKPTPYPEVYLSIESSNDG